MNAGAPRTPRQKPVMGTREERIMKESIRLTLLSMGMNPDDPLVSQQTFVTLNDMVENYNSEEGRADRAWLRKRRLDAEKLQQAGAVAVLLATISGIIGLLVAGAKMFVGGVVPPHGP